MGRIIRRRWMEIMERFIRLNRSILDCDLAKGGWRLDEEGIAASLYPQVAHGTPGAHAVPRPPLRRPLPRRPDGDALGRCGWADVNPNFGCMHRKKGMKAVLQRGDF